MDPHQQQQPFPAPEGSACVSMAITQDKRHRASCSLPAWAPRMNHLSEHHQHSIHSSVFWNHSINMGLGTDLYSHTLTLTLTHTHTHTHTLTHTHTHRERERERERESKRAKGSRARC